MSRAAMPSHFRSNSCMDRSSSWMSSSINWGSVGISSDLAVAFVEELVQEQAGDHVQGLEHALAFIGRAAEGRHFDIAIVEQKIQVLNRRRVREVALIELQHVRDFREAQVQAFEV